MTTTPRATGSAPSAAEQAAAEAAAAQQAANEAQASQQRAREQAARIEAQTSAQPQGGHGVPAAHWMWHAIGVAIVLCAIPLFIMLCFMAYRYAAGNDAPVVTKQEPAATTSNPVQQPQGQAPVTTPKPELLPAPAPQPAPVPGAPATAVQAAPATAVPQGQQPQVIYQQAPVYMTEPPAPGVYATGTVEATDATVLSFRKSSQSEDVLFVGPGRHLPKKVYAASCPMQIVPQQLTVPVQVDVHCQGGPVPPQAPVTPQAPNPPATPAPQVLPQQAAPAPAAQQTHFVPATPRKTICQRHPFN